MSSRHETSAQRNARRKRQRDDLRRRIAELEGRQSQPPQPAAEVAPPTRPPAYTGPRSVLVCEECEEPFAATGPRRRPICPTCSGT